MIGFYLARNYFSEWVNEKVKKRGGMTQNIYTQINKNGFKAALMLRISPLPSWFCTYALAITTIELSDFAMATAVGSLPMIMYLNLFFTFIYFL